MKRKSLSKKIRFEVFKRDKFTCQYCGAKAPEVILHIDHIQPIKESGTNDILNLITSCLECNLGKSKNKLSDDSVISKKRNQLESLQEKRQQMEMLFEWQKSLLSIEEDELNNVAEIWHGFVDNYRVTTNGRKDLLKLIKKFGSFEVIEAIKITSYSYLKRDEQGRLLEDSVHEAFHRIGGICVTRKRDKENPELSKIYYIRAILKRRFGENIDYRMIEWIKKCIALGADITAIENHAKGIDKIWNFENILLDFINKNENLSH